MNWRAEGRVRGRRWWSWGSASEHVDWGRSPWCCCTACRRGPLPVERAGAGLATSHRVRGAGPAGAWLLRPARPVRPPPSRQPEALEAWLDRLGVRTRRWWTRRGRRRWRSRPRVVSAPRGEVVPDGQRQLRRVAAAADGAVRHAVDGAEVVTGADGVCCRKCRRVSRRSPRSWWRIACAVRDGGGHGVAVARRVAPGNNQPDAGGVAIGAPTCRCW